MSRVEVANNLYRWAMERSNKRLEDLEQKFPRFPRWLEGEQPTLRQLEKFAQETRTPLGYFFLKEPPTESLPMPHFRTVREERGTRPSPELIDTVHSMERRQEWLREYLMDQGADALGFVNSLKSTDSHLKVAERIRNELNLEVNWAASNRTWGDALDKLQDAVESVGIYVVRNGVVGNDTHRKLSVEEFRGFVLVDDYAPLVFLNGADAKSAQMFTIAHELAHIWFGSSAAFDLRQLQPADDRVEVACNKVAAEFLVPEAELRSRWVAAQHDPKPFTYLARRFKVSEMVIARRALDLRFITRTEFFRFYEKQIIKDKPARKAKGGKFNYLQNNRVGKRFGWLVISAAREGKLTYPEAFRLTGLYGKTFDRFAEHLGM